MRARVTVVIPPDISLALREALESPLETAGVLLAGVGETSEGETRLLARELHLVETQHYEDRRTDEMTIASSGYMAALARAEEVGATALWVHTHPGAGASPTPSRRDKKVDRAISEVFRLRTDSKYYGAIILAQGGDALAFSGHLTDGKKRCKISRLWEVGPRLRLTHADDMKGPADVDADLFDRNVRALGGAVQKVLGDLHVGVVGCGGTGSAVAEQLVRLGVRHMTLIDPDKLSESNLTRVYGSRPRDVGRNKAQALRAHLTRIAKGTRIKAIDALVTSEAGAKALVESDVVFGCTDDNAGRLVLSRLAAYFLVPLIDCGVILTSDSSDQLTGIDGRVTVVTPGSACLVCRDRIDLYRAQAEVLPQGERERLQREGYAAALPGIEPAVVTFTTAVAAAATGELLERLVGFGPEPVPGEVLVRFHDREISTNVAVPRSGHYCDPVAGKLGVGSIDPFLEQTWPN